MTNLFMKMSLEHKKAFLEKHMRQLEQDLHTIVANHKHISKEEFDAQIATQQWAFAKTEEMLIDVLCELHEETTLLNYDL